MYIQGEIILKRKTRSTLESFFRILYEISLECDSNLPKVIIKLYQIDPEFKASTRIPNDASKPKKSIMLKK